ncbi:hypothetical protein J5N97_003519 [Dioscorea zingiberensis]|uniref:Rab-GAP TBC domain-containing protein n=1 Tax=Dioscorea zingiberensis TaxID=325984 RepID=A0A9D5D6R5_9LILI|nr:hypothetical protein J5N97_003519 [Dioscorea zingiberensis]
MPSALIDPPLLEPSSLDRISGSQSRFSGLRGVRWRIALGVLPGAPSASVDELRRVTADSRRRYATLRRRLLVDPHFSKDGNSPDLTVDNPLSQNPDSMWGRYFRNAELEKMVDRDLSRLYPEHGSYFQTPACQSMLRRILLMWCLRHPDFGYRQGMHELLAPLIYVLHVDVRHLSEVRKIYEDYFNDDFDDIPSPNGAFSNYRFTKAANWVAGIEDEDDVQGSRAKPCRLEELDPDIQDIFLLSDAYGAEGELGIIFSERFMEHDAYCMFEGLMNGNNGVIAMVDFFSPSPATGSNSGLPPVIEASSALYHLLCLVDSSLHSHLVELGVEPQYFALRWLRVLFGREFALPDLLIIWDEIFSSSNGMVVENNSDYSYKVLCSPRGAFISAMAVSMLLYLRSSLLSTEYATSCLQRLLNFPQNIDVMKLIEKAKSLQVLALETDISPSLEESSNRNKPAVRRVHSLSSASVQTSPHRSLDGYWEEKWRILNREEALNKGGKRSLISKGITKGKLVQKLGLSRTDSDPLTGKPASGNNDARFSVRRNLVNDFSREINSEKVECDGNARMLSSKESISVEVDEEKQFTTEATDQNIERTLDDIEDTCLSRENSSVFSNSTSPHSVHNNHENDSESSVSSNSFVADNDGINHPGESCSNSIDDNPSSQYSEELEAASSIVKLGPDTDKVEKQAATVKERKLLSGKFHWLWKFGKGLGEENSEKRGSEGQQSSVAGNVINDISSTTISDGSYKPCAVSGRIDLVDKKMMNTLKNLRQSMLENIQVIESVFQQDRGQVSALDNLSNNVLGSKGQATAMTALKELRKISNLIAEM